MQSFKIKNNHTFKLWHKSNLCWFLFNKKKKGNSYVIESPEDLEKIPPQRKYLMALIQTHGGLILRNHAKICAATQNLRQKDNLIERNGKKKLLIH